MRLAVLVGLVCLVACGDPALRDRSLMAKLKEDAKQRSLTFPIRRPARKRASPTVSVVGLAPDPLAQYYDERARVVLRFDAPFSLGLEAGPQLEKVAAALPDLRLPDSASAEMLLRRVTGLPETVSIDPARPFAIVFYEQGHAAIVSARAEGKTKGRLRKLDGIYSVAGDPKLVKAYKAGFRKGFFLPGDCSVIAKPQSFASLGSTLQGVVPQAGLNLRFLDAWLACLPTDVDRVDLSCRFGAHGLRVDLRAAPGLGTPLAAALKELRPGRSAAARWLPAEGTAYVETLLPPRSLFDLGLLLAAGHLDEPSPELERLLPLLERFTEALGSDASVSLKLKPDGTGTLMLVAHVDDPAVVQGYLSSEPMRELLDLLAGDGGHLEWRADAFERSGVPVGVVTGHFSRDLLLAWRQPGRWLHATLSMLLKGPVFCYTTVADRKFCLVAGPHAREDMERLLDRIANGSPADTEHNEEVCVLFQERLAAASVDLASLFDGCREAAPYWHEQGRVLRDLTLRWRLPAATVVTVEGDALRLALRLRPEQLAKAVTTVLETLRTAEAEKPK